MTSSVSTPVRTAAAPLAATTEGELEAALSGYILTELAAVPVRHLDLDLPLFETLLDSTSVLALVSHLEEAYGIEIRDSEVVPSNFATLRRLIGYVQTKTRPTATPLAASG